MLVTFFSGPTCHRCEAAKKWWNDLVENNTDYDFSYEDTALDLTRARQYQVCALPTFLLTEGDTEVARVSGDVNRAAVQFMLNKYRKMWNGN